MIQKCLFFLITTVEGTCSKHTKKNYKSWIPTNRADTVLLKERLWLHTFPETQTLFSLLCFFSSNWPFSHGGCCCSCSYFFFLFTVIESKHELISCEINFPLKNPHAIIKWKLTYHTQVTDCKFEEKEKTYAAFLMWKPSECDTLLLLNI